MARTSPDATSSVTSAYICSVGSGGAGAGAGGGAVRGLVGLGRPVVSGSVMFCLCVCFLAEGFLRVLLARAAAAVGCCRRDLDLGCVAAVVVAGGGSTRNVKLPTVWVKKRPSPTSSSSSRRLMTATTATRRGGDSQSTRQKQPRSWYSQQRTIRGPKQKKYTSICFGLHTNVSRCGANVDAFGGGSGFHALVRAARMRSHVAAQQVAHGLR